MSILPEYRCPRCGKEFLMLSPKEHHFFCGFCGKRWMINDVGQAPKCKTCGRPGLINPETMECDNCFFKRIE